MTENKTLRERYLEAFTANLLKMKEITEAKGKDYAAGHDPFKNFRESAEAASIYPNEPPLSLEQTILVRLADKDSRIKNLLGRPGFESNVADEKITDTLLDRAIYTIILLTWIQLGHPDPDAPLETIPEELPEHHEEELAPKGGWFTNFLQGKK